MLERIKNFLLVTLAGFAHFLMRSFWRMKADHLPDDIQKRINEGKPVIFGHLHQDDMTLIAFFKGKKVGVLVSHSKDGTLLADYFKRIGFVVARGSSSKGAASGFLELLRLSESEKLTWITFAVDGPRGPLGKSKKGIFKLAGILEAPIVPVAAMASSRWTFRRSWSKTYIPKPFSSVRFRYLKAISVEEIKAANEAKDFSNVSELFDQRIAAAKGKDYYS